MFQKDWFTLSEAAKELNTDINTLLQAATRGEFSVGVLGRNWRVRWVPSYDGIPYSFYGNPETDNFDDGPVDKNVWISNHGPEELERLWEFYINDFWLLPQDEVTRLVSKNHATGMQLAKLIPVDLPTYAAKHTTRVTEEGCLYIRDGQDNLTIKIDDIVVLAETVSSAQKHISDNKQANNENKTNSKLTIKTLKKVAKALYTANKNEDKELTINFSNYKSREEYLQLIKILTIQLSKKQSNFIKSDGEILVGTSTDANTSGIVWYLIDKEYSDLGKSSLSEYISKALKS